METIIDRVIAASGHYEGHYEGRYEHDAATGDATIDIAPVVDGMGAEIRYQASAPDGSVLHAEHTILAFDMWSGEPTLYVLCPELRGLGVLALTGEHSFSNRAGVAGYELQIDVEIGDGVLQYVWSQGLEGDVLAERSRAVMRRAPTA